MNQKTIRLLILHEDQNGAEQLINVLRSGGHATRAHQITDVEDLKQCLQKQTWDLLLARPKSNDLTAQHVITGIQRLKKDIPTLLIVDEADQSAMVTGLKMGAQDVVSVDEDQRLMLVTAREMRNLNERRARRRCEVNLHEAEKRCHQLLDHSRDAIAYITDGMHVYANKSYRTLFGYLQDDELECLSILDMVAPDDHEKIRDFLKNYKEGNANELMCTCRNAQGDTFDVTMTFSPMSFEGEACTQIALTTNVENSDLQRKLREVASQDILTGLYNRHYFLEQLDATIERATNAGQSYALLYIAIDQFQRVKAQAGLAGTDLVLGDIATLLNQNSEAKLLSHFGDDIFTEIVSTGNPEEALEAAETIREKIENYLFEVDDKTLQISVSVGVTMITDNIAKAQEALVQAHEAVEALRAETPEGNAVRLHVHAEEKAEDTESKVHSLNAAFEHDKFVMLYQPIISLRGDENGIYEALLRMKDDNGKLISPLDFLGAAKLANLNEKIDRWVCLQVIKALSEKQSDEHTTRVLINLTVDSVVDESFIPWLGIAIKAAHIDGSSLVFQMRESEVIAYLKQAKRFHQDIKELHCEFSISQFGCSAHPFNTLKHVPADYLKIDPSFTQDIDSQEAKDELKTLVNEAHDGPQMTIATQVESAVVLSSLWQLGADYVQGYYLQQPGEQMDYDFGSED